MMSHLTVCFHYVGLCDVTIYYSVLSMCGSVWCYILQCVFIMLVCVMLPCLTVCYHCVGLCDVTMSYSVLPTYGSVCLY